MVKKLIPLIIIVALVAYFLMNKPDSAEQTANKADVQQQPVQKASTTSGETSQKPIGSDDTDDDIYDEDILPATQLYSSSQEAYDKLLAAAEDYDDIVLEQFAELGPDCTWCPDLYASVKDKLLSTDDENLKSYFAEVLTITGEPENVQTIIEAYKGTDSEDDRDIYLEALEYTAGGDDLVELLSEQLATDDVPFKESIISALSNHGGTNAIEDLYAETVKNGDPDGYYGLGIGIGEVIPEPESLPLLEEYAAKGDQFSHLAVKSLLNYGDEGLRKVADIIASSDDPSLNAKLLEDAVDHVAFDENTETIVNELLNSPNKDLQQFGKDIKEDMELYAEDEDEEL